ncbi:unnamed protein product [Triticum turgidum subsp. durum]|uniref:Uncharacterized protein n=1 Tax=Triticum turgidum subsp. durum TaxID=4567 RepID=A0A9R0X6W4_TRITD|nr:unnamed protein product [Triticum turgidum subsp. durum]
MLLMRFHLSSFGRFPVTFLLGKVDVYTSERTSAGFVCVRGFDRTSRAPRPLYARLHFPASKVTRNKKGAASAGTDDA